MKGQLFIAMAILGALTGFSAVAQTQQQQTPPTCASGEYHALDFWLGEWDVTVTGTDQRAGASRVTSDVAGCAVTEHWSGVDGTTGQSLNVYDRELGHWEQLYVGSGGGRTDYVGNPIAHGMQLVSEHTRSWVAPGVEFKSRLTLTSEPDGSVRQVGETSGDGLTWTKRYDLTYRHHVG